MINFWKFSISKSKTINEKYQSDLIRTIIYNIIIDYGPQHLRDIYRCFNVFRGGRKIISDQLRYLTTKNFGPDPLLIFRNGKYHLNDKIKE